MRRFLYAAFLTILLVVGICALTACSETPTTTSGTAASSQFTANPPVPGEVEAAEYQGTQLTPIKDQNNNALTSTQHIEKATYRLTVDGLVDNPLTLRYDDLLGLAQVSKLIPLNCVEGWNFTAKWTGPSLAALLAEAKVQSSAKIAIFYTQDVPTGYSSLDLDFINAKNIILGMKLNDLTLPDDRGFPFQVVAESKYGYKWAKWITRIELSDDINFRGFWETKGYNNDADDNGPAFGS